MFYVCNLIQWKADGIKVWLEENTHTYISKIIILNLIMTLVKSGRKKNRNRTFVKLTPPLGARDLKPPPVFCNNLQLWFENLLCHHLFGISIFSLGFWNSVELTLHSKLWHGCYLSSIDSSRRLLFFSSVRPCAGREQRWGPPVGVNRSARHQRHHSHLSHC